MTAPPAPADRRDTEEKQVEQPAGNPEEDWLESIGG